MSIPPEKIVYFHNSKLSNCEQTPNSTIGTLVQQIPRRTTLKTLLTTICFAIALLTCGVASAQDTMNHDNMKADASKAVDVKGKISDDGKMFVSDKDSKNWTISNPDAVKGHEGHHVILTAHVDADKSEVHVMSLKMAK
jgi:hypothetical protein